MFFCAASRVWWRCELAPASPADPHRFLSYMDRRHRLCEVGGWNSILHWICDGTRSGAFHVRRPSKQQSGAAYLSMKRSSVPMRQSIPTAKPKVRSSPPAFGSGIRLKVGCRNASSLGESESSRSLPSPKSNRRKRSSRLPCVDGLVNFE